MKGRSAVDRALTWFPCLSLCFFGVFIKRVLGIWQTRGITIGLAAKGRLAWGTATRHGCVLSRDHHVDLLGPHIR